MNFFFKKRELIPSDQLEKNLIVAKEQLEELQELAIVKIILVGFDDDDDTLRIKV